MYLEKIKLQNFRNYQKQEIVLEKNINIFYGDNAQGKTNILEAIFLCSFGKSFRTNKEKELIYLGEEGMQAEVFFQKSDREGKIKIGIGHKKQIEVNGVKIKKLSKINICRRQGRRHICAHTEVVPRIDDVVWHTDR